MLFSLVKSFLHFCVVLLVCCVVFAIIYYADVNIQGESRETDVFQINITPLIFSVEFFYYHEMIRYYMPFCVRFAFLCFRSFLIRQHVAGQNALDSSRWPLSLFPHSPNPLYLKCTTFALPYTSCQRLEKP